MTVTPNADLVTEAEEPTAPPPTLTAHPLYQQVESLINQGNWQAAMAPLTELQTIYPDNDHLQDLVASARTRSALLGYDQELPRKSRRRSSQTPSLRMLILGLVLLLVLSILLVGGGLVFSAWLLPQLQEQREEARISQLKEEAQNAIDSGDYDRAVFSYNNVLQEQPDDSEALDGLERAKQLRATASLYGEAIMEMEAHHWEDALALLQQIEAEEPSYGDVGERIQFIQAQQNLSEIFNEAEAAFNQGNYELAAQTYETLQAMDYGFQHETVENHLFLSYLQLGLAQEAAAGSDPEQLDNALITLEKALALRPDDSQARGESQLIRLYLSGLAEYEAKNWPQAISAFAPVYDARPDFAGGTISRFLYTTYLAWGDELFADDQVGKALDKYEEADSIKEIDSSEIGSRIVLAEEALAPPTPTPTPTPIAVSAGTSSGSAPAPTATPQPLPYSLKGMSVRNNCSGQGYIHGVVWSAYDMPLAGVTVRAFNTTTGSDPLVSNPTNGDGIYQIVLNGDQVAGLWMVHVLDGNSAPASRTWGQHLGGECVNGAQELKVDWQRALQVGE